MFIWFVLSVIIAVQSLFTYSFVSTENSGIQLFGWIQLTVFASAIFYMMRSFRSRPKTDYRKAFNAFGVMIASGVPGMAFLIPGIIYFITGNHLFLIIGWALSACLFIAIMCGIIWGRWHWKTHKVELFFPHLPQEMDGVHLVQISDVHVGSFFNKYHKVEKAIRQINDLNADYVFFTGDLVNNASSEMNGWEPVFEKITATKGKYSILGNHDYGDYVRWEHEEAKKENLNQLIETHRKIGFEPLLNQAVSLHPEFWLLGVENWGKAPFRQSGELLATLNDVPDTAFKLLLSHDPSHFDEQVTKMSNIDLTLSGHTHGMQFGIERFGLKWSPVSWRYKKWAGLYKEGLQYLYVNRGFGYLGFPGRVGIYPEITSITLRKSN
jgi:predicted MPP superfamily phosphohydrolase